MARPFVAGYESYSYDDGPAAVADRVAPYVTPPLHDALAAPSQAGPGAALVSEQAVATATARSIEVEAATPSAALLLVTASVRTTSTNGSSVTLRYVPVSLTDDGTGWKVDDVDGLMTHLQPVAPPAASPIPAPAGGEPPPPPPPPPPAPPARPPSAPAHLSGIPDDYLSWYEEASTSCPGLSWAVLAAIGTVESDNGQSSLPGVRSGANYAGAEGPMQFLPATFAAYGVVAPGGASPASPYDPPDAVWSAARLLCADGAGTSAGLYRAIFAYNHSAAYVADVLALAGQYQSRAGERPTASESIGLGSVIVHDAEALLGTPYVWGGESPRVGFDCSGLVQWVLAEAGLDMPRVAQAQYDAGPHLPAGAELYAGDLVFFGSGPRGVEHVGIYVGAGRMIDAPHTGAVVRIEPVAGFNPAYVGATRPEVPDVSSSGPGLPVVVGAPGAHRAAPDHPAAHRPVAGPGRPGPGRPGAGRSDPTDADAPVHHRRHPVGTDTTQPDSGDGGNGVGVPVADAPGDPTAHPTHRHRRPAGESTTTTTPSFTGTALADPTTTTRQPTTETTSGQVTTGSAPASDPARTSAAASTTKPTPGSSTAPPAHRRRRPPDPASTTTTLPASTTATVDSGTDASPAVPSGQAGSGAATTTGATPTASSPTTTSVPPVHHRRHPDAPTTTTSAPAPTTTTERATTTTTSPRPRPTTAPPRRSRPTATAGSEPTTSTTAPEHHRHHPSGNG